MGKEYQLELSYFKVIFKSKLISESTLKLSFYEGGRESIHPNYEPQQLKIDKQRSVVELININSAKIIITNSTDDLCLKYELRGKSIERVRNLQLNPQSMISQFQISGKNIFEQKVSGAKDDIIYILTLSDVDSSSKQINQVKVSIANENSFNSRTDANVNVNGNNKQGILQLETMKRNRQQNSFDKAQLLGNKDQIMLKQDSPVIKKKTSGLPLSEIQKVNQLMASHEAPHSEHGHQAPKLSIKLKLVILLFFLGIGFLFLDTLNDFTGRRKRVETRQKAQEAKARREARMNQKVFKNSKKMSKEQQQQEQQQKEKQRKTKKQKNNKQSKRRGQKSDKNVAKKDAQK